jgi:uncharacterized iron-regulated protein
MTGWLCGVAAAALVAFASQGAGANSAPEVVFIGEVHDNPGHHVAQAAEVARLRPAAIVFEMLTGPQAKRVTPDLIGDATALEAALEWAETGWPDFAMYYPIFQSAPDARIYGAAIPRDAARAALVAGVAATFGADAARFGLTEPLPAEEQTEREADQMAAHCNALSADLLPGMVDLQRMRDANLARAALQALDDTGGPVVVIAGNGHVRLDRGAPVSLARAAPEVRLRAIGQDEAGRIDGRFSEVWPGNPVDRADPCAAFR